MSFERLQLGRYQLQQKVGSGGMGEVYLAEDSRIHRQVAIKVVRNEPASPYPDTESARIAAQLFEREMKIISQLDHPHILPLYDYGETEIDGTKTTYMVMPYRPEGSLLTWLRQRQSSEPLAPQIVASFIEQAASALQHAHERQVIHQDIKPSNFLIRVRPEEPEHPDLLLTDFGISRSTTATSSTSQTIQGTPTYMAPEQWEGHPTYASDQYALAVMAYELLVGRPPFVGKPGPIMYQHMTATPLPPTSLNPALSTAIDIVLLRALAKKPDERFPSVSAFASALQQAVGVAPFSLVKENATHPGFASDTYAVGKATMRPYALNTAITPETPTAQSGAVRFPLAAPNAAPTLASTPPTPAELLRMNSQSGVGEPVTPSQVTPATGPGIFGVPSMLSATSTASRLSTFRSNFSAIRVLLIALILVIGIGGTLFYYGVFMPKGEAHHIASQQDATNWSQVHGQITTTVQGTAQTATKSSITTQRQATAQAQATVQATTPANTNIDVQATAQANAQATAQAQANVGATATAIVASITPLYRLNNSKLGDHFYTTSASERDRAIARSGYQSEGIAAYVFNSHIASSTPLYRLVSAKLGDHFYTTSASERDKAVAQSGYTYEGIACYVYSSQVEKSTPLYRLYNSKTGDHFYTTSASERNRAVSQSGYTYEWIAAYVLPA